jgi:saccharopine dehydrogenase (NAD+, L-lysine-forming)
VFNLEQFDPDPFMDAMNQHGLPWTVITPDAPMA